MTTFRSYKTRCKLPQTDTRSGLTCRPRAFARQVSLPETMLRPVDFAVSPPTDNSPKPLDVL